MIGIYGANGFIGRALTHALAVQGLRTRAISRRFDPAFVEHLRDRIDFVEADFMDPLPIVYSLQDVDTVVQLISTSSPGLQNLQSISDIQDNVIPHVRFLQSCIAAGVRRYIFLSSGGTVYGPNQPTPIKEEAETNPISSHGLTKLIIEKYIRMHAHVDGLEYVVLRLSNPFGPGQTFRKGQGLIPAIIDRHLQRLPVRIIGDGSAKRDYIYVSDVTDAIIAAIRANGPQRQTYNIGLGEGLTVVEVIEAIEAITGITFAREFAGSRKTDVDVNVLDVNRARSGLGWAPKVPFRTGLRHTLAAANLLPVSAASEAGLTPPDPPALPRLGGTP